MDALQKRKYLIDSVIWPFLKKNGFKKMANTFYINGDLDTRMIELISNKFNSKESVRFGFMIRFYNILVYYFFAPNVQCIKPPKVPSYLDFHIDQLLCEKSDRIYQYEVEANADLDPMIDRLYNDLNELLMAFSKLDKPLDYLKLINISENQKQMVKIYCLFLLLQENDIDNSTIVFNDLYKNFDGHKSVKENLKNVGLENKLLK